MPDNAQESLPFPVVQERLVLRLMAVAYQARHTLAEVSGPGH